MHYKRLVVAVVVWAAVFGHGRTAWCMDYYIDNFGGDDVLTEPNGSFLNPFQSFAQAIDIANDGDTIWVRGGTYDLVSTIRINNNSGSPGNPINMWAYPGEEPILDFTQQALGDSNFGLRVEDNWWHVKGLTVQNAGDSGVQVTADNNVLELMVTRYNRDTGLQVDETSANNLILNCDSYENFDENSSGEDADGFAAKSSSIGVGNIFRGNRSWGNSDDGWDTFTGATGNAILIQDSWSFDNGKNIWGGHLSGDGTGFKLGNNGGPHILHNVLAVDNISNGIDQNSNGAGLQVYNSTSFSNNRNWQFDEDTATHILKNNISFVSSSSDSFISADDTFNSWNAGYSVSTADFVSITRTVGMVDLLKAPRQADGSLPDLQGFLELVPGSDLVDTGTPISFVFNGETYNLPYNGTAPDLGAFETAGAEPILYGDYNDDGIVNAADYTVFLDHYGATQATQGYTLPNEGDSPGVVDDADYIKWRDEYGNTLFGSGSGSGFSSLAAVPEPGSLLLLVLVLAVAAAYRRWYA